MAISDARKRATANFHDKRKAEGWRKLAFWLPAEAQTHLDALAVRYGSKDAAITAALARLHSLEIEPGA